MNCKQVLVSRQGGEDGSTDETAVDFRGNPVVDKFKTGGWLAAGLILGIYPHMNIHNIYIYMYVYVYGKSKSVCLCFGFQELSCLRGCV